MKHLHPLVPSLFLTLPLIALSAFSADWPNYHGPNQDGVSYESGWSLDWKTDPPDMLWKTNVGRGFSSVTVVGDRLFTMGFKKDLDSIYCLDAETGKEIWSYSYPSVLFDDGDQYGGGACSTPTVANGKVFTLSKLGLVHCFDAQTGEVLWSKQFAEELGTKPGRWGFSGSILIDEGKGILDLGRTVAFDPSSGDVLWKTKDYEPGYSTPTTMTLGENKFILVFNSYGLVILEPESGKEVCAHPWETDYGVNSCIPQVIGDKIYISADYGHGCALLRFNGDSLDLVWEKTTMMNHFNTASIVDGYAYGFNGHVSREGEFKCISLETGDQVWETRDVMKGSNLLVDGKLLILTGSGELVLAEPSPNEFKEIGRIQALGGRCWTEPAFSNGRVYCRNSRGDLVCLDLGTSQEAG
ncbi:MAG: PQQ-binding-like beta-propeller repeat protein [Candidatus Omnitrophica bacterium]|nr:PQQ-binding-like beta-propeller repeat protein [Candidatus Omnitrophota bacterium]